MVRNRTDSMIQLLSGLVTQIGFYFDWFPFQTASNRVSVTTQLVSFQLTRETLVLFLCYFFPLFLFVLSLSLSLSLSLFLSYSLSHSVGQSHFCNCNSTSSSTLLYPPIILRVFCHSSHSIHLIVWTVFVFLSMFLSLSPSPLLNKRELRLGFLAASPLNRWTWAVFARSFVQFDRKLLPHFPANAVSKSHWLLFRIKKSRGKRERERDK